jgi:hypothetical protein
MDFPQTHLHSLLRGRFRNGLGRKRSRFFGTPETKTTGTRPGNSVPHDVRDGYDSVVKGSLNINIPFIYRLFLFFLLRSTSHISSTYYLRGNFFGIPPTSLQKPTSFESLLFLSGDGLLLPFPRTGIRPGPLAPQGKTFPVAETSITAYIHKPLDVKGYFRPKTAFHLVIVFQNISQIVEFILGKIVDHPYGIDIGLGTDFTGGRSADAVNIGQRDIHVFIREVNPHKTRHKLS